jgi:hypothetical protein
VISVPNWSEYARVWAAALLLVCVVLPFSTCSYGVDKDGVASAWSEKPAVEIRHEHRYPWIMIARHNDWQLLLAIIWPIPVVVCRRLARRRWQNMALLVLEPALVVSGMALVDFVSSFLVRPAIGAYLMQVAYVVYGAAWLSDVLAIVRTRLRRRIHAGNVR